MISPSFLKNGGGGEVCVDCGAFSGDIVKQFAKKISNYRGIYAIEADKRNIQQLKKTTSSIRNVSIVEKACSDFDGKGYFEMLDYQGGSRITNEETKGAEEIDFMKIDSLIGDGDCHFIKMDIEGGENAALHGAAETIRRTKPKLAISIYHSDEDMIRLIEYIHQLVPEYRLYVRAHTMGTAETIMYAMV